MSDPSTETTASDMTATDTTAGAMLRALTEIYANANRLVATVGADQWSNATPCTEWSTRDLVNHMAGTSAFFVASAGRTEPTTSSETDHLGDDPVANFAAGTSATIAAWSADGALEGDVTIPGPMPAVVALGINILDIGTHCWDLARSIGEEAGLTDDHVRLIDHWNRKVVTDEVRAGGGFGAALDPAGDGHLRDMLAFVGRTA